MVNFGSYDIYFYFAGIIGSNQYSLSMKKGKIKKVAKENRELSIREKRKQNIRVVVILAIFVFILYGNSISNEYSMDDNFVTNENSLINKGFKAIPEIFTTRYSHGEKQSYEYRPIVKVSFAIESGLFGTNAHVSHFINILLYLAICVLLFFLLKRFFRDHNFLFPFLIVLLYMAHPIHTEVVSSLKNRDELISFLFCLISLYCFIRYTEKSSILYFVCGVISYLVAFLSKPSAMVFIAVIPFVLLFFYKTDHKKLILIAGVLVIIFLVAYIGPKFFLPRSNRAVLFFENPLHYEKSFLVHLSTGFYTLIYYIRLLLYPHPLLFYYGYDQIPVVSWSNGWAIFSLFLHGVLAIYAIRKFRERHVLSFAIIYYFICISMFSNIVKPAVGIVAERFLFAASLGFCIALVYFFFRLAKADMKNSFIRSAQKNKILLLALILLLPYTIKTISRNRDWKSEVSLYSRDVKYLTRSAKANVLYAGTLLRHVFMDVKKTKNIERNRQKINTIIKHYNIALDIYPEYANAYNNLASIYIVIYKQYEKAIPYLERAVELDPLYYEAFYNLGFAYEKMNMYDKALHYYNIAKRIDPEHLRVLAGIADLYDKMDKLEEAIKINKKIMEVDPSINLPYINIGNYYLVRQDTATAVLWWEKAVKKDPPNRNLLRTLTQYYGKKGDTAKSKYYYNLMMSLKPEKKQRRRRAVQ